MNETAKTPNPTSSGKSQVPSPPVLTGERPSAQEPIPVRVLQFVSPQTGPGLSAASSCTAREQENARRHTIAWHPWVRAFFVQYLEPDKTPTKFYIPEHRVASIELY